MASSREDASSAEPQRGTRDTKAFASLLAETSHVGAAAGGGAEAPEDAGTERRGAESAGEPFHRERPPEPGSSHP